MTTTIDRAEINRRNSIRSTGPRSPEGKQRSKFNAVKHGMSAATPVLPGEDPDAFRDRLDAWAGALDPDNVVEQFLVERAAAASWKIERADRFEAARPPPWSTKPGPTQHARRREEVDRLGRWLLPRDEGAFDSVLTQMVLDIVAPGIDAAPWRAMLAAGIDRLRPIVDRLESSAEGCAWLLERWAELHEPLRWGFAWNDRPVRPGRPAVGTSAAGDDRPRTGNSTCRGGIAARPGVPADRWLSGAPHGAVRGAARRRSTPRNAASWAGSWSSACRRTKRGCRRRCWIWSSGRSGG